jgi:ribosome-associated heat shock protein Hsp15
MSESIRLDKWLWFARFFKTRSLATKACAAGKVKRGGHALKPATPVQAGDVLEIPFPDGPGVRTVTITALLEKRVGAVLASEAYADLTPEAVLEARRVAQAERVGRRPGDQGRPTKRDRRAISRIRGFFD